MTCPQADQPNRRLVILESPYAGPDEKSIARNVAYARMALRDSLLRGEAPIASHLLYTQPGVLDDGKPDDRKLGIEAGLAWGSVAMATVVYADLGISSGMDEGISRAEREGRTVEERRLGRVPYLCEECEFPATHVQGWKTAHRAWSLVRAWCDLHVPIGVGHYEWCPVPCRSKITEGRFSSVEERER